MQFSGSTVVIDLFTYIVKRSWNNFLVLIKKTLIIKNLFVTIYYLVDILKKRIIKLRFPALQENMGEFLTKQDSWGDFLNIIAYIQKFLYIGISFLFEGLSVNDRSISSFQGQSR